MHYEFNLVSATPGSPFTLDIDGHFAFGGSFTATGGALNAVQFGDENSTSANAQAEVTELEFSQGAVTTVTGISRAAARFRVAPA